MIKFQRYAHVNDFIDYYLPIVGDSSVKAIIDAGVSNEQDTRVFVSFIIRMVDAIHSDADNEVSVLGDTNNADILPDISYEMTSYMRKTQYFHVLEEVFD